MLCTHHTYIHTIHTYIHNIVHTYIMYTPYIHYVHTMHTYTLYIHIYTPCIHYVHTIIHTYTLYIHTHTNGKHLPYVFIVLLDNNFVEVDGILELVSLHEENVTEVHPPDILLTAQAVRRLEEFLHLLIVLQVPVDLCLLHQDHRIPKPKQKSSQLN